MWLYLKTGFYSVVKKTPCKEDELLVRARSKIDLDRLQEVLKTKYKFKGGGFRHTGGRICVQYDSSQRHFCILHVQRRERSGS
jgi:mRNA-degrading endonuclease RelE of RelBE toxin-antitoxin system